MKVIINKSTNNKKRIMHLLMVTKYHVVIMVQVILVYTETLNVKKDIWHDIKNERWGIDGIKTVGLYSRWVLWNMPTIESSIADSNEKYKDVRFKYVK